MTSSLVHGQSIFTSTEDGLLPPLSLRHPQLKLSDMLHFTVTGDSLVMALEAGDFVTAVSNGLEPWGLSVPWVEHESALSHFCWTGLCIIY